MSVILRTRLAHLEHYRSMMSSHPAQCPHPRRRDNDARLSHWRMRDQRNCGNNADRLSSAAVDKITRTIGQAWQNSTLQKYHGGVKNSLHSVTKNGSPIISVYLRVKRSFVLLQHLPQAAAQGTLFETAFLPSGLGTSSTMFHTRLGYAFTTHSEGPTT